jgi:hypothetical protein
MTDDHEALVSENQRLRKANRRWRFATFVAVACALVVMVPLTVAIKEGVDFFESRDTSAMLREQEQRQKRIDRWLEEADRKRHKEVDDVLDDLKRIIEEQNNLGR